MGEIDDIKELKEKVAEMEKKRRAKSLPVEKILLYFIVIVCAPWLPYVVKNLGKDGWSFSLWDKWRFHWIGLTYLLYFGLGFLLFPAVQHVLYVGFPILLAVGIAGLIPMSFPVLWVSVFVACYVAVAYFSCKAMSDWHTRSRVQKDTEMVKESGDPNE